MATQMINKGSVEFQGQTIEFGKPVLVNGRQGVPFLAWVRDQHTTIRVKWSNTYMPSDFSDRFGPRAVIAAA